MPRLKVHGEEPPFLLPERNELNDRIAGATINGPITSLRKGRVPADLAALGLLCALTTVIYWRWLGPGTVTDQDWWNYTSLGLRELFPWPSAFNFDADLGSDWLTSLNYFPFEALDGILGRLGVGTPIALRAVVIWPTILLLPLGAYFLWRLYFGVSASLAAALFYSCNAYINVIVARGQLTIAESYAAVPLTIALAVVAVRRRSWEAAALCGAAWTFAFACDVRIALLGLIALAIIATAEARYAGNIKKLIVPALACVGTAFALLTYVWMPLHFADAHVAPPKNFADLSWITQLSFSKLTDVLAAYKPLWFDNHANPMPAGFAVYSAVLCTGILAAFFRSRKRLIAVAFLLILATSAVAASGNNTWFGPLYVWLFEHTWFFKLFRDPSKFYAPAMLAYAFFFGAAVQFLIVVLPRPRAKLAAAVAFGLLAAFPMFPALAGWQQQLFVPKTESPGESRLRAELENDGVPGRVLWIAAPDRMVPGDRLHPALSAETVRKIYRDGKPILAGCNDAANVDRRARDQVCRLPARRCGRPRLAAGLHRFPDAQSFRGARRVRPRAME